jgi:hypothetical protein
VKSNRELLGFSVEEWNNMNFDERLAAIHDHYSRKRWQTIAWGIFIITFGWTVSYGSAIMSALYEASKR